MNRDQKLQRAMSYLGSRWILHPSHQVKRKDGLCVTVGYIRLQRSWRSFSFSLFSTKE